MMNEEFSINDYKAEGVRMLFKPQDLVLLYSYSVASSLSLFGGVVFKSDYILVDFDVLERFEEVLLDLNIFPRYRSDTTDFSKLSPYR